MPEEPIEVSVRGGSVERRFILAPRTPLTHLPQPGDVHPSDCRWYVPADHEPHIFRQKDGSMLVTIRYELR